MHRYIHLLSRALRKNRVHLFVIVIVFGVLFSTFAVASPWLLESGLAIIEETLSLDDISIFYYFGLAIASYLFSGIFQWLTVYFSVKLSISIANEVREEVFEVIMKAPIEFLDESPIGLPLELVSTANDHIQASIAEVFKILVSVVVTIIAALIMMYIRNWLLATLVLVLTPMILLATYLIGRRASKLNNEQQILLEELNGQSEEYISKQKLLIAYDFQGRKAHEMDVNDDKIRVLTEKSQYLGALVNPTTRLANYSIYALVAIISTYFFMRNEITIATIIAFISYSNMFAHPFEHFSEIMAHVVVGNVAYFRTLEYIESVKLENENAPYRESDRASKGAVTFENVSFSYEEGKEFIKHFSMEVKPKSKIAIVGPTGSGKSTLLNLLLRFREVDEGKIYVDGKDVSAMSKQSLRQSFGLILQNTWLFEGTIRDNISYGFPSASFDEIQLAAEEAGCHELIKGLKDGYDTFLFDGYGGISSGEKQLITIARALLIKPTILLLDEATSNVDSVTEERIQKTLDRIIKNHTTFVVAHRLNTVSDADLILVMKNGKLVEHGKHDVLLAKRGLYYRLITDKNV